MIRFRKQKRGCDLCQGLEFSVSPKENDSSSVGAFSRFYRA